MRKTYPDTREGVQAMFRDQAVDVLANEVERLEKVGEVHWVADPEVEMVWGLFSYATGKCLVIAYLEECDFEMSADSNLPI